MNIDAYPVQRMDNRLIINDGQDHRVELNITRLCLSLEALGFVITYPPPQLLKDIQEFLKHIQVKDCRTTILGDMITIGMFMEHQNYMVTLAPTHSRLNVSIMSIMEDGSAIRFSGYVESLEEFKLIWSRIL